jgi:predicted nucleic acid-binding protein
MILADTNIFLEILLEQDAKEKCKEFLAANPDQLYITDFSLHSIGLILFQKKKHAVFTAFVEDVLYKVTLISLPQQIYQSVAGVATSFDLDFDDAYQFCVSKEYNLEIATQDKDFNNVKNFIPVRFI